MMLIDQTSEQLAARDLGVFYTRARSSIDFTVAGGDTSTWASDIWSMIVRFLPDAQLVGEPLCKALHTMGQREFRRRRAQQSLEYRRAREQFAIDQREAMVSRAALDDLAAANLDMQFTIRFFNRCLDECWTLLRRGARLREGSVNCASMVHSMLSWGFEDKAIALESLRLMVRATDWRAHAHTDQRRAVDVVLASDHPAAFDIVQVLSEAGFVVDQQDMASWSKFMNDRGDGWLKNSVVHLAASSGWFDLASSAVLGQNKLSAFPINLLGMIPSDNVLNEFLYTLSERGVEFLTSDMATSIRRELNDRSGQSPTSVVEFFLRLPTTRRLLRKVLIIHVDLRRVMLDLFPEALRALVHERDIATIRLLADLEMQRLRSLIVHDGQTLLEYIQATADGSPRKARFIEAAEVILQVKAVVLSPSSSIMLMEDLEMETNQLTL